MVLNNNYEPLSVCNVRKAIILIILDKAELVEKRGAKVVRSVSKEFPFPSIVKLAHYVKVPYKRIILSRKNILRRDKHSCQYCGSADSNLTIDHVLPRSRFGEDTWENLVCACVECNNAKGDKTPDEAKMHLIRRPIRPNHIIFIKHFVESIEDCWKPYLFIN
ncbi:MAG: HNH endonuclease [Ignavibacteria bacterium]|nr:HNH endonuclease [Bacteroidota bacterium]MSQ45927.1 HNH endonuclease [Ignavibacteria bacterium]